MQELRADHALFAISVTSDLTGVQPQALRDYEARGLLDPHRTAGGTRRYSQSDLERVRRISTLLASGLNLTGVLRVMELEAEAAQLRDEISLLRQHPGDSSGQVSEGSAAPRTSH